MPIVGIEHFLAVSIYNGKDIANTVHKGNIFIKISTLLDNYYIAVEIIELARSTILGDFLIVAGIDCGTNLLSVLQYNAQK